MTPSSPRAPGSGAPSPSVCRSDRGVIATTDRYATEVGLGVLSGGGNAVDAAVAASFALAVVNPEAGNLGGGGFTLVRLADGTAAALDHRSTAPAAATRDMFLDADGELTERSVVGFLAAAVPGAVRGARDAWERFGRRPWAELVQPAVELAEGFPVTERLTRSYEPHIVAGLRRFPETAEIFLPGGEVPEVGSTFRQADLAGTLARIRDHGADGFYRGETAALVVRAMEAHGGIVTREDLAGYRTAWREPLRFPYRDRTVLSMPPSSSGGVALAEICRILAWFDLGELPFHGADHVHLLAEAWKRAYADRNRYLADPDFADVPVEELTSEAYGGWRAGEIDPERATPSAKAGPGLLGYRDRAEAPPRGRRGGGHTTHLSVVDAEGNAVSLTTTLNTWYGSKAVVPGAGFLLNNEMDDLTALPGAPNFFGLVQGEANAVEPGKRPLSAMTPTLVLDPDGALELVVGTPGGATITTTVFQVLSNVVDHGMGLSEAVAAPRVHHQHLPDEIVHEPGALTADAVAELEARGHRVRDRGEPSGDVMAVRVHPDGTREGVADPRRGGVAAGE